MHDSDRRASIVAGTDGSPSATETLHRAAALARSQGALLHVVSAHAKDDDASRERAQAVLDATEQDFDEPGVDVRYHPVPGDPARAMCTLAQREQARLIVVGNRGTDG